MSERCPLCASSGLLDRYVVHATKVPCLCQDRTRWIACADGPLRVMAGGMRWFSFRARDDLLIDGLEITANDAHTDRPVTSVDAVSIQEFVASSRNVFPRPCQVIPKHYVVTFSGFVLPAEDLVQLQLGNLYREELIVYVRLHTTLMDTRPRELEHAQEAP